MTDDLSNFEIPDQWKTNSRHIVNEIQDVVNRSGNVSPLLPLLFRFNGKPVTLAEHYPLEICFFHKRPRRMIKRCGRQVGKSFQNALELILRGLLIPHWNVLYVTPMFEQVRKFSTQYVHALISESPAKRLMTLRGASSQVLQRTLGSGSTLYFSYAQTDANRARGINANEVGYDEVQLMSPEVFPVLQQVMGGSPYGEYETYAGTPLSKQNPSEKLYQKSSMSEWMIRCRYCGYDNVAGYNYDLLKMIGPVRDDISRGGVNDRGQKIPRVSGLTCARCSAPGAKEANQKPLFPEDGHWLHLAPERRKDFLGIHIPQAIMPWHAYSRERWLQLNNRLAVGNEFEVFNEILGEPCDSGFKPISESDLRRCANLNHKNTVKDAYSASKRYSMLGMGIDWGGGGMSGMSRTKAAIIGLSTNGKSDILYGVDLNFSHKPYAEVEALMALAMKFGVQFIAHDVGGGVGATRESMMYQTKKLACEIIPIQYVGPMSQAMVKVRPPAKEGETPVWVLDKGNSLTFLCQAMKQGHIRTFDYDFVSNDNPGCLHDFTSLTSEIARKVMGSDTMIINKEEGMSDDFAHAVNFAMIAMWGKTDAWPRLSIKNQNADEAEALANTNNLVKKSKDMSVDEISAMIDSVTTSTIR